MAYLRRIYAVVLLMMLLPSALAEARLCVSTETGAALLSLNGEEILPFGTYADVFCVEEGALYAAGAQTEEGVRYALCDGQGQMLTEPLYRMLQASDGVILCRLGRLCGALNPDGTQLLPADYTQLTTAGSGAFFALTSDPYDDSADEILLVSTDNEVIGTGIRTVIGLQKLSDGRMLFREPDTELYGYLNADGTAAVPASFEYAGSFENGIARASSEGAYGVIDCGGQWRIPPVYDFLEIGDGIILGLEGDARVVVYDAARCAEKFSVEGEGLRAAVAGKYAVVVDDGSMRVFDSEGNTVLEAEPDITVAEGIAEHLLVCDDEWGAMRVRILREDGALGEERYQHLLPLDDERYVFVTMRVAAYYSDALDEVRYSCDYDSMRCGLMDGNGREILPAEFMEITRIGEERYLTIAGDGLRVVDGEGRAVWSRVSEEAEA